MQAGSSTASVPASDSSWEKSSSGWSSLRAFDDRIDDVGLAALPDLFADELPDIGGRARLERGG